MHSDLASNAIDVTRLFTDVLPQRLANWESARLYLVSGTGQAVSSGSSVEPLAPGQQADARYRGGLAPAALRRVTSYIEQHLARGVCLQELAAIAGLSSCHFARAFKQSTGLPPHRYLLDRRIARAMLLIGQSARPLAQIGLEVGFFDQSHFTRWFTRLAGNTPRAYRRLLR